MAALSIHADAGDVIVWYRAERLDRPLRPGVGDVFAEFAAAGVGTVGEGAQVVLPGGVVDLGDPVGEPVAGRVQVDGVGDAVVDDRGEAAGVAEVAAGDRGAQDVVGVVAGDLGLAQDAGQAEGALVGGERRALGGGEGAVVGEAVEHGRGAPGGGDARRRRRTTRRPSAGTGLARRRRRRG